MDARLSELETALREARRIAEQAAARALNTSAPEDYAAAIAAAAEVDRIWQQYGERWRLINGAAAQPPVA